MDTKTVEYVFVSMLLRLLLDTKKNTKKQLKTRADNKVQASLNNDLILTENEAPCCK